MSLDCTGWAPGPWDGEPDRIEWRDQATGYPCLMVRNRFGSWCGYVGLPPGHRHHGHDYDDVDAEVHGGLTYSAPCDGLICHVPRPGESADVWWLGFDCNHSGDLSLNYQCSQPSDVYRDVAYVKRECTALAQQLA